MIKYTEEQIQQVVEGMRKGVTLRNLYVSIVAKRSDAYGFHDMEVGTCPDLFPMPRRKSLTSYQTKMHRRTNKRFSVKTVDGQLQLTRLV